MFKRYSTVRDKALAALMIVMMVFIVMPVNPAYAANTGEQLPTGCANQGTGWTNPGNANTSDNVYATTGNFNREIRCSYNISVPAGNIVTGIAVIVEGSSSGSREADVALSWNSGTNWTNSTGTSFGGTENNQTFGNSADTWGHSWTLAELTTMRVRLVSGFGTGTISLDNVRVIVYYDLPPEIDIQGNGLSIADGDNTPSTADGTNFGDVGLNFAVDRTFTIFNTGTGTLTLSNADVTGTSSFSLLTSPASSVPPGGSTTFVIRFEPNNFGGSTKNATFSVDNNDTNENPYTFDVTGVRVTTEINVQGNGNNIADGDNTPSATDGTDFGNAIVGATVTHTFTVQNQGTENLYLDTITFTGDFSLGAAPTSPVAPGGSTTFTVNFTPTATGTRNGSLSFINNDTNESPYNFSLRGNGTANTPPTITSNGGGANAAINVPENTTAVTTVTATDPNVPPQTLTYSISGTDASFFNINASSGVLAFNSAPDFEAPADSGTDNVYNLTVQVSDGAGGTDTQALAVTVTNVNEAPTDIALSNNAVDENQPVNTSVGTLSATDPDVGNTFTFSFCGGADDAAFGIVGTTLQTAGSFNYEAKNSYAICVRVTDQNSLTFDKPFTINVNNVNEAPTDVALSNTNADEHQPIGTTIGNLSSSDPDAGDSFTYSFCGG
ncbi:MAG TPA: choice-of-anchor D domain-containing protein, partial [Anaerolineales bacterium]|nr:choice-of-anchor D domain-containing protein [Anaerolineales bacterium]